MSAENVAEYIEAVLLPRLTPDRARAIFEASARKKTSNLANHHAQRAAMDAGIEGRAVAFSERLRKAAWDIVWDGSQVEAWEMSWILARVGMAISTVDLVGTGEYTIEDYIDLVEPWVSGFPDFPLPVKEEI